MYFTWVMDHFLYIAMIGPIGLVVASVDAFLRRDSVLRHAIVSFAAALVVFVLGGQSRAFAAQWRDGETLWTYTVNHAPSIWLPHYNLGNAYRRDGRLDDAIAQYRESIGLHPDFDWSHDNLGIALAQDPDTLPDAIVEYRAAIRLRPGFAEAHNNLANALARTGHAEDAIPEYQAALAAQPGMITARFNLALAYLDLGRKAKAADELHAIIRQQPDFTAAHVMLQATK